MALNSACCGLIHAFSQFIHEHVISKRECIRHGRRQLVLQIRQDGLKPDIVTYGSSVKGYAWANNLKKTIEKYKDIRVHGITTVGIFSWGKQPM